MSLPRLRERQAVGEKIPKLKVCDTLFAAANDMSRSPLGTHHGFKDQALRSAVVLMQAGAHIIKSKSGGWTTKVVHFLVERGIPVCAHPRLTLQTVHALDGSRAQGKADQAAATLKREASALQDAGVAMLMLVVTFAAMLEVSKKELREVTQAEAFAPHLRATGLLFALSKPAQAGLQPQRIAPRKPLRCVLAKPSQRPRLGFARPASHCLALQSGI